MVAITVARILVVEDEPAVRQMILRVLETSGQHVLQASSGHEALTLLRQEKPDLIILDLRLPDRTGQQICQDIRSEPMTQNIPILVLTGLETDGLASQMLDLGADDYLPKPFDKQELVSRVRALLRRPAVYAGEGSIIRKGRITIDVTAHQVSVNQKVIKDLSPKEFDLLKTIVMHAPRVLDKETLARAVWQRSAAELHPRTMDVHIRRIRRKLEASSSRYLRTIPSIGYQWYDPAHN